MKPRLLIIMFALLAAACSKPKEQAEVGLNIGYEINGKTLIADTLCYENEAGNRFLVTEIQWFLSNIELKSEAGEWVTLHQSTLPDTLDISRVFYIDTNLSESQTLHSSPIGIGRYTALRFTFGLDDADNRTGLFTDPPESEMFWPEVLGGGYHYMKLNGKFVGSNGRLQPLAIHLGIGQNGDFTEFYPNYFVAELPIDLNVTANAENRIDLTMVVDNWFRNPHTIDFNETGSGIMQNQAAQRLFNGNGQDVFRIGKTTDMENENKLAEKLRSAMRLATPKPQFWSWKNVKDRIEDLKLKNG